MNYKSSKKILPRPIPVAQPPPHLVILLKFNENNPPAHRNPLLSRDQRLQDLQGRGLLLHHPHWEPQAEPTEESLPHYGVDEWESSFSIFRVMEVTNYIEDCLTGCTGLWSNIIQKDFLTVTHSCICLIRDLTLIHMHIHRYERSIQLRQQELWYTGASPRPIDSFSFF